MTKVFRKNVGASPATACTLEDFFLLLMILLLELLVPLDLVGLFILFWLPYYCYEHYKEY